jgi:hypothetical protein
MAYLGLSAPELAERFHKARGLTQIELNARFGAPRHPQAPHEAPYWFLDQEGPGVPNYLQFRTVWTDEQGRQYQPGTNATTLMVRLPVSITRRENEDRAPTLELQDFPQPRDLLVLRHKGKDPHTVQVNSVLFQRRATALLQLAGEAPEPPIVDREAQAKKQEQRLKKREERGEALAPFSSRAPRERKSPKKEKNGWAIPKIPKLH